MISVSLDSVSGASQGIPKLTLNLTVETQSDVPLTVVNLTAAIRVTPELIERDLRKSYFIGTGFLESTSGGQLNRGSKGFWQIGVPLSPYQLQKIEEMRKGKDLFLNVQFSCTAACRSNAPPPMITDITTVAVRVSGYSDGSCPFKVPQSDWVKTLAELGYGDYFLMEIPLEGVPERRGMQKAVITSRQHGNISSKATMTRHSGVVTRRLSTWQKRASSSTLTKMHSRKF